MEQQGKIGITILANWFEPATQNQDDVAAARRMMDFNIGWFVFIYFIYLILCIYAISCNALQY